MDRVKAIVEEVKNFHSKKVELSEENTKLYLILPIFEYLGWNYRSFREVRAEFVSDVRSGGAEKVDFAIMKNNEPYIFVECKPLDTDLSKYIGQLERYYSATIGVRYGILTDGNKWLFFTDNDNVNLMDKKPFYTLCLEDFKDSDIEIFNIFKKENFENISSDLRSFLLKNFMQRVIKGEDKEFLNWVSEKLKFRVKSEDIQDLGLLEEAVQNVLDLEESDIVEPVTITSVFPNNSSTFLDNQKPKKYRFQGVEYVHRNYGLEIKRILEYYIDNDKEAYKKVQSLPINCNFILYFNGRNTDRIKTSSMGKVDLKDGNCFYIAMGSKRSKNKIIELLNMSTKGQLDFEFIFEDVNENDKNRNEKIKYKVFNNIYEADRNTDIITNILNILIEKDLDAINRIKNWSLKSRFFLHNENRVGEKEEDIIRNYHTKAILSDGNYYMYHGSRGAADSVISQILAETNLVGNSIEYLE